MAGVIERNRIYTAEEIGELLRGHISLALLRQHGLRGLPGAGYWGGAVIKAIDAYCQGQRGKEPDQAAPEVLSIGRQSKRHGLKKISDKDIGLPVKSVSRACYRSSGISSDGTRKSEHSTISHRNLIPERG